MTARRNRRTPTLCRYLTDGHLFSFDTLPPKGVKHQRELRDNDFWADGRLERSRVRLIDSGNRNFKSGKATTQMAATHRAAASALSSGRVLKAIAAHGAALRIALMTTSNNARLRGGRRTPPPMTPPSQF